VALQDTIQRLANLGRLGFVIVEFVLTRGFNFTNGKAAARNSF
jgi:hypothetical protein